MAKIRWLLQKDIKSVLEIQSFYPFAPQWSKKDCLEANRSKKKSYKDSNNFPIIYIYEEEGKPVGFINYKVGLVKVEKSRIICPDNFVLENEDALQFCLNNNSFFYGNITSFCVHPDYKKRGIGKELFNFVINKFSNVLDLSKTDPLARPFMLFTRVSERDLDVLNFLKKMNFQANRISWDYYGKDHDAYNFYYKQLEVKEIWNA
jgi:ribosomal protein S18 acetylase RimI-like enzyme